MALTVRERYLLATGISQGIGLTREAFKAGDQGFFDSHPFEIAVDMMRWNEEPENIIDLEKGFDEHKDSSIFQDIDPQSTGSDTHEDVDNSAV